MADPPARSDASSRPRHWSEHRHWGSRHWGSGRWGSGRWPHGTGGPWAHAPGPPGQRSLALHAVFAAASAAAMSIGTGGSAEYQPDRLDVDARGYVLIAAIALGLLFRRAAPLLGLAITAGASAVYFGLGYPAGPVFFAIAFLMVEVAMWLPTRTSLIACSAAVVTVIVGELTGRVVDGRSLSEIAPYLGWLLVPWAAGAVKRAWREGRAQQRAESTQRRRYEERLAVVREVHDVVGHGLAVINLQASVALHVLDRRPEQAEVALTAIKQASKDSLDELRATLAVFRNADGNAPLRPTPGLRDLVDLVSSVRVGGLAAELTLVGEVRDVPASLDLAAYRIVQESLTNVVRHARAGHVEVTVTYETDTITVQVIDDGTGPMPGPDAGQGIIGMRERATSLGGWLTAGAGDTGGYVVNASIPLPDHVAKPEPASGAAEPASGAAEPAGVQDPAAEHLSGRPT